MVTLHAFVDRQTLLKFADRYPELDIAAVETCLTFLNATAEVQNALEAHFARQGLSMGKFTLLMQLLQAGEFGLSPSEAADRTGVSRATITGLLDGLEREDWVARHSDTRDRRMLRVQLTENGKQKLLAMLPDHFCRTTNLMANLSASEKKTFTKLLKKLQAGTSAMTQI